MKINNLFKFSDPEPEEIKNAISSKHPVQNRFNER